MESTTDRPTLVIERLVGTLLLVGAVLISAMIIAPEHSWHMKVAIVAASLGFLSFTLTYEFLITIEMQVMRGTMSAEEKAQSLRLAFPFLLGVLGYALTTVFLCVHMIVH